MKESNDKVKMHATIENKNYIAANLSESRAILVSYAMTLNGRILLMYVLLLFSFHSTRKTIKKLEIRLA